MGIRFLQAGCDEREVARAIANQINEEFPEESESIRLVCRNTFVPDIKFNDEAKWYEDYNGFMTEKP